ncbi:MAG: RNA polymerase factor sigma-32 [Geminicoccaceae bacterium]
MAHRTAEMWDEADRRQIRQSMAAPMLDMERERELARAWRDNRDSRALDELIGAYMRLVIAQANRFRHYGLPLGDLRQEGVVGLIQAADRFDPERGLRFSTYAGWWVRSAMQEFVLRNWSIVRLGSSATQKSLFFRLRRLRARIRAGDDELADGEVREGIARALSVRIEDVERMEKQIDGRDRSLNMPLAEGSDESFEDRLEDEGPDPETLAEQSVDGRKRRIWLSQSIAELNERERTIIRERRLREDGRTLEELGRWFGISKERVRQIEQRALLKLKASLMLRLGPEAGLLGAGA